MTRVDSRSARLNFGSVRVLLADNNQYYRRILHSMLRNFGAKNIIEVASFKEATAALNAGHIDLVLCDHDLADQDGLTLVRTLRANKLSRNREVPILVMVGDPRLEIVGAARDAGANMVIGKPVSPAALFDRLLWVAVVQRQYCETDNYYGPDRRFRYEGFIAGAGRRKSDVNVDEIDALFTASRAETSREYAA